MSINFKDRVYPFTTEMIDGYIDDMDLKDKTVLTVGSSGDQAFNCALKGASEVSVIDISTNTKDYMDFKKDIILNSDYDNFYYNLLKALDSNNIPYFDSYFSLNSLNKMNSYMKKTEDFEKMKEILKSYKFEFINGDIFKLDEYIQKKYQRIIFSNVLQYLKKFAGDKDFNEFVSESFNKWNECITDDGIIELMYLYGASHGNINSSLEGYTISQFMNACGDPILSASDCDFDVAILYEKRLQLKK